MITSTGKERNHLSGVGEVGHQVVGRVRGEVFHRVDARGHGQHAGAHGAGAADVERGVANHQHAVGGVFITVALSEIRDGFPGDIVPVGVMVSETAEIEVVEDVEMAQLGPGAAAYVTREQADADFRTRRICSRSCFLMSSFDLREKMPMAALVCG